MYLNGSVDRKVIDTCLDTIKEFFDGENIDRKEANGLIYQAFYEVGLAHAELLSHTDTMIEIFCEYFLKPLYLIMPDSFGFSAMLTVFQNGQYDFKIISRSQADYFVQALKYDKDPCVTLIGDWLFIIKMDQLRKLLPKP